MREVVFDLPLRFPAFDPQSSGLRYRAADRGSGGLEDWFGPKLLSKHGHPVHYTGVRVNSLMQPVDEAGHVVIGNVRVAGKALAGYNALVEGSAEGVWLATAYRAATQ
jgi:anaerobic glycerol-3-phosphate dehydrogenase